MAHAVTYPAFLVNAATGELEATQNASWLWIRPGDSARRFVGIRVHDAAGCVWTVDRAERTLASGPWTQHGADGVEASMSQGSPISLPAFIELTCRAVESDSGWWADRPDVSSAAGLCRLVRKCHSHREVIDTLDAMW